jgi:hypothetical protein
MNVKTLGQIAYSAYLGFAGTPEDLQFSSDAHREAWEAAAQAVKRAVLPSSPFSERQTQEDDALMKARDAVVEAAKAWAEWRLGLGQGNLVHKVEDALVDAIEALEELER